MRRLDNTPGGRRWYGRRARVAVVLVLGVSALFVGCGGSSARGSAAAPKLTSFRNNELAFRYPVGWGTGRYKVFSTMSREIVFLSNEPMHSPCVTHRGIDNTSIICTQPVKRLDPHSLVASWSEAGNPAWSFRRAAGTPLKVGGRHAKLLVEAGDCGINASVVMDVVVQIPRISDNYYDFNACIRGPGTTAVERQARALLNTVRFAQG